MIFSKEAPTLEKELHKVFTDKKANMLNYRKEFFNVTLEEIEAKIKETEKSVNEAIADEFPSLLA